MNIVWIPFSSPAKNLIDDAKLTVTILTKQFKQKFILIIGDSMPMPMRHRAPVHSIYIIAHQNVEDDTKISDRSYMGSCKNVDASKIAKMLQGIDTKELYILSCNSVMFCKSLRKHLSKVTDLYAIDGFIQHVATRKRIYVTDTLCGRLHRTIGSDPLNSENI